MRLTASKLQHYILRNAATDQLGRLFSASDNDEIIEAVARGLISTGSLSTPAKTAIGGSRFCNRIRQIMEASR